MSETSNEQTFKVNYINGSTTLNTRPAQWTFSGNNVKVVLLAHKDDPESVLFDVSLNEISGKPSVGYPNASMAYTVHGKDYAFVESRDLSQINKLLKGKGVAPVRASKFNNVLSIIIVIFIIVFLLILFLSHHH